jgi:hypothetical protein
LASVSSAPEVTREKALRFCPREEKPNWFDGVCSSISETGKLSFRGKNNLEKSSLSPVQSTGRALFRSPVSAPES